MRQIPLDIRPEQASRFEDFVPGQNAELLERLRHLGSPQVFEPIYIWGEEGCGRSHLLAATAHAAERPVSLVRGGEAGDDLPMPRGGLLIVDEVEALQPQAQVALFRAINSARFLGLSFLMAGSEPPLRLALREDLRTRIGQALIYEVHPLSDEEKLETLARHAKGRGLRLEPEVALYLLRHGRRDLGSLLAALDRLDELSLVEKRPPSLSMAREVLSRG